MGELFSNFEKKMQNAGAEFTTDGRLVILRPKGWVLPVLAGGGGGGAGERQGHIAAVFPAYVWARFMAKCLNRCLNPELNPMCGLALWPSA